MLIFLLENINKCFPPFRSKIIKQYWPQLVELVKKKYLIEVDQGFVPLGQAPERTKEQLNLLPAKVK